jgi:tyrosyl-tRNA synthetase
LLCIYFSYMLHTLTYVLLFFSFFFYIYIKLQAINVNKCTASGGTFVFWVADWFALMNDKMGGDLDKIKDVGRYFVEVWTAAGMDMSKVEFRWASDDITQKADTYWPQMLDIARRFTLARVNKCCTIMGR